MALTASAGIALTLVPTMGTAGAETFTDPNDRCLPDAEAPPAPVSDRNQITPLHIPSVDCIFAMDIARGFTDGTYKPFEETTRGQMATFIVNALEAAGYDLPAAEDSPFTDIAGSVHEENIEILATIGVTKGTSATTYSPTQVVHRDQMASYLVQAAEYAFGTDDFTPIEGVPAFPDVPPANVHFENVNAGALVLGLVDGRESGMYNPNEPVLRQQMASFLVRLVDLTLMVE